MSVLQPKIPSLINGTITVSIDDIVAVQSVFDQLLLWRSVSHSSGPFSNIATVALDGAGSYTFQDLTSSPIYYYKAQFYNSGSMISSTFSELAQDTATYTEYSLPVSSATYPPEIALSGSDREIVEAIRITVGDLGFIENDYYDSRNKTKAYACADQISADQKTWELINFKGWPQRVTLNGVDKTSLMDPLVLGYRYLTFSGAAAVVTGTLNIYYNHFRFSDREVLLVYDRANNLLVSCGLPKQSITREMLIMQAAILLLEGEIREDIQSAVKVRDGDTEYDNTGIIKARTEDMNDLKRKMKELLDCARAYLSLSLPGVRLE